MQCLRIRPGISHPACKVEPAEAIWRRSCLAEGPARAGLDGCAPGEMRPGRLEQGVKGKTASQ